ncbi:MAG: AsmA family protein [Bacteroidales bacterium]|nr:AsmA family protein [Bacteroidales bacterium]
MKIKKKHIWFIILLVVVILLVRYLFFGFSLNNLKATIEEEIDWATGMESSIEGNISGKLLPSFAVVAERVMVRDGDFLNIYADKLEIELPLWSLFSSEFVLRGVRIKNPEVVLRYKSIDTSIPLQSSGGGGNVSENSDSSRWKLDLVDIRILNGSFSYFNLNNLDTIQCHGIYLTSDSITLSGDADTLQFSDVLAMGKLTIADARVNSLLLDNILLDVEISNSILNVSHKSELHRGQSQHGNFYMDLSSDIPSYHIMQDIDGLRIEKFLGRFEEEPSMKGKMDFSIDLRFSGKSSSDLWLSSSGEMKLNGDSLILYGTDLDKVARQFERTQKFNLIDVSALFLAGPVGIAITKGGEYANLLISNKGDSTFVHEFVSNWRLSSGELSTEDVAFSTQENRIAVRGAVNLWNETFNDLEFALINDWGCAVFQQNISGHFTDPDVSEVKVVKTILAPVKNIFKGKKCKNPFYEGTVKPHQH